MKKILLILSIVFSSTMLNAISFKADVLTGDTKLACEAILCLSSGTRPSECSPSIKRYFSIHKRHWSDTVNARRNFLRLCPVGTADMEDKVFADLRDNVLPNLEADKCTAKWLNNNPDKKCIRESCGEHHCSCVEYLYRPATKFYSGCEALYRHEYSHIKPKNICGYPKKWYSEGEWESGYSYTRISYSEYQKLSSQGADVEYLKLRYIGSDFNYKNKVDIYSRHYTPVKKNYIKKDCWVNP